MEGSRPARRACRRGGDLDRCGQAVGLPAELDISQDVLFCGVGQTAVMYYRCMLPALTLGCDWVGVGGLPPKLFWATGLVRDAQRVQRSVMPDFSSYKIVVLQQPAGPEWRDFIKTLRDHGVKVIYEVDDYLHGIPNMEDHDFRAMFTKKHLWEVEQTMKVCDGLIASTEWIRGNYSHFQKRAFLCRNGLDVGRYELTIPERQSINVGWAGATGHLKAVIPWFQQVAGLMKIREDINFVSVGQDFARGFQQHFSEARAVCVPWAAIEQYPSAMTMFDIALAPGGTGGWWRGKSDLRFLEAGALGIPIIANPRIYPEVEDGVTGFTAMNPMEMAEKLLLLVESPELRTKVGASARRHVRTRRDIKVMARQWVEVFEEVWDAE